MKNRISQERWVQAQKGEVTFHVHETLEKSYEHYGNAYSTYFKYLDINRNLNNKSVLEIGPARFAALLYCENYKTSYIVNLVFTKGSNLIIRIRI